MSSESPLGKPEIAPAGVASDAKQARPRVSRTVLVNGVALLLLLAGYGAALLGVVLGQAGVARATFTLAGAVPVPVLRLTPAQRRGNAIAIIVHGFASDKELMTSIGLALAHIGVPSLLLDAPGFGQSPVSEATADQALRAQWTAMMDEAVAYAYANAGVPNPRIVAIGHSMGAFIVGLYSQSQPPGTIAATILISGALTAAPTTTQPANLLVIAGQSDLPGILPAATRTVAAACGGSLPARNACGEVAQGTGRRLLVVPGANHISIITDPVALGAVNAWVAATDGLPAPARASADNGPVNWLLVGVACAILALFPLLALLTGMLGLRTPSATQATQATAAATGTSGTSGSSAKVGAPRVWPRGVGLATLATAGGVVCLQLWVLLAHVAAPPALASPLAWIHLAVGDVAGSLVLLIAGVLALVAWIGRQRSALPPARHWARQVAVGAAVALFLYLAASSLSSLIWERFWLDPPRLIRAVPLALAALAYFALMERAIAPAFPAGSVRALLTRWYLALVISMDLFLVLYFIGGQSSGIALLILPLQLILFVFIALVTTWLGRLGRDTALASAVFAALLFAWIVAATLPITG